MSSADPDATPAPEAAHIAVSFVRAPFETVAAHHRGECAAAAERAGEIWYEVSGDAAGIEQPNFGPHLASFAPEFRGKGAIPSAASLKAMFPLRGAVRLSRPRGQHDWVMVEDPLAHVDAYGASLLSETLGLPILIITSITGPDPVVHPQGGRLRAPFGWPTHGFALYDGDVKRSAHLQPKDGKPRFGQWGPLQSFEEPARYRKRLHRDRMDRALLFSYLVRLGIDAEGVFGRRELEDALLITSDHEGVPLAPSPEQPFMR